MVFRAACLNLKSVVGEILPADNEVYIAECE